MKFVSLASATIAVAVLTSTTAAPASAGQKKQTSSFLSGGEIAVPVARRKSHQFGTPRRRRNAIRYPRPRMGRFLPEPLR